MININNIPKNRIKNNLYSDGINPPFLKKINDSQIYIGYYNIISSKYFTEKQYNNKSIELKIIDIKKTNISNIINNVNDTKSGIRYFMKEINSNPIKIKEIDKKINGLTKYIKVEPKKEVIEEDDEELTPTQIKNKLKLDIMTLNNKIKNAKTEDKKKQFEKELKEKEKILKSL